MSRFRRVSLKVAVPAVALLVLAAGGGWYVVRHHPAAADLVSPWAIDLNHSDNGLYTKGDEAYVDAYDSADTTAAPPLFSLYDYLGNKLKDLPAPTAFAPTGHWRYVLPTDTLGYFEVRPTNGSASLIPAIGTRPAGILPYAVENVPYPDRTEGFTNAFLGIQGSGGSSNASDHGTAAYPYIGANSFIGGTMSGDHGGAPYSMYYQAPTEADLPLVASKLGTDTAPAWYRAKNYYPFFTLNSYPAWALDLTNKDADIAAWQKATNTTSTLSDASLTGLMPPKADAYRSYLTQLAQHMAASYDYLPQHVYQVTWEPEQYWGWIGSDQDIVNIYKTAYPVLHQYDPKAVVVGPTMSGMHASDLAHESRLMKQGLASYIDAISIHSYSGGYPTGSAVFNETTQQLVDGAAAYNGGKRLPILGTEGGVTDDGTPSSILDHSFYTAQTIVLTKAAGWQKYTLFYLADVDAKSRYGLMYNDTATKYGAAKLSPKPAVPMARQAMDEIGYATPVAHLNRVDTAIEGEVFKDAAGSLIPVLWDSSGANQTVTLKVGAPNVTVVDAFGNKKGVTAPGNLLTLKLTAAPTYVEGATDAVLAADALVDTQSKVNIRLNLPYSAPADQTIPGAYIPTTIPNFKITLTLYPAGSTTPVLSVNNLMTASDGTFAIRDATNVAKLSDTASYDMRIHVPGYLDRMVKGVSHILSQPYAYTSEDWVVGDYDQNNKIELADILTAICQYNAVCPGRASSSRYLLAGTTFPAGLDLRAIITVIKNYNLHSVGP